MMRVVLPTCSIDGDADEAALVVAEDEGGAGIGAESTCRATICCMVRLPDGTANSSNLMPRFSSAPERSR